MERERNGSRRKPSADQRRSTGRRGSKAAGWKNRREEDVYTTTGTVSGNERGREQGERRARKKTGEGLKAIREPVNNGVGVP